MTTRTVLVINSGSSSIKYQLVDPDSGASLASGLVERIGEAEDMAGLAIFLAARSGDYVVGETVVCDGGIVHAQASTHIDA